MSLARLALRLAAYEALNPFATMQTGPWPTIAGKNVFDSRIDLIQEDGKPDVAAELEGAPLLIVYTEEDNATPYQGGRKFPDDQVVHLVVEAMIAAAGSVTMPDPNGGPPITVGTIEAPISDRQHEAMLDLLEALVRRLFDTRNLAPSSALFGEVALETREIRSYPQRGADRVTRMAARTIKFEIKVRPDAWAPFLASPAPNGIAALPEPLRTVAQALPTGSSGLAVCQQTAASLQPPVPQPTTPIEVGFTTDLDRDPSDAVPTQSLSLDVVGPGAPLPLAPPAPTEPS